ncbi:hypothetical protein [Novacetimonas sp. GS1]|uniref:hypothetical protein n=1 Tax=Novacetimonas sp. GS1 TaxID=3119990 RepID=UPI002FCD28D5
MKRYENNITIFILLTILLFIFVFVVPLCVVTFVYPRSIDFNNRLWIYGSSGTWATVILAAASIFFAWKASVKNNQIAQDGHFLGIVTSIAKNANDIIFSISPLISTGASSIPGERAKWLLSSAVTTLIKGRELMNKIFENEISSEKYMTYISIYLSEEAKSEFKNKKLLNNFKLMDTVINKGPLSPAQEEWYKTLENQYDDVSSGLH